MAVGKRSLDLPEQHSPASGLLAGTGYGIWGTGRGSAWSRRPVAALEPDGVHPGR